MQHQEEQGGRLWRIQDVARYLDIHESTVRRWVKSGAIPHSRLGRRGAEGGTTLRFDPEAVREWSRSTAFRPTDYQRGIR